MPVCPENDNINIKTDKYLLANHGITSKDICVLLYRQKGWRVTWDFQYTAPFSKICSLLLVGSTAFSKTVETCKQWNIVLYTLGPTDCWCPMSPNFLTRWVASLLGLAQVSVATARVGVHRLFPLHLPYLGVFPFTLHLPLDFICVSSLRPTYLHPFDRPFTCWWWVSRLGNGSGTRCCGPRGRAWGAHEAEISFQISVLAGVWTSDLAV